MSVSYKQGIKCLSCCAQRAGLAQSLAVLGLIVPAFGNCADVSSGAPPAPDRTWQQPNAVTYSTWAKRFDEAQTPAAGLAQKMVDVSENKPYELAELIDIAQRTNPETRVAWERARQAAIGAGMVESNYYPMLAVQAAGIYQRVASTIPKSVDERGFFRADAEALVPAVTLKWLMFDFGG